MFVSLVRPSDRGWFAAPPSFLFVHRSDCRILGEPWMHSCLLWWDKNQSALWLISYLHSSINRGLLFFFLVSTWSRFASSPGQLWEDQQLPLCPCCICSWILSNTSCIFRSYSWEWAKEAENDSEEWGKCSPTFFCFIFIINVHILLYIHIIQKYRIADLLNSLLF